MMQRRLLKLPQCVVCLRAPQGPCSNFPDTPIKAGLPRHEHLPSNVHVEMRATMSSQRLAARARSQLCSLMGWSFETGDHTRSISLGKASQAAGGIMKFAKVQLSCMACKSPLGPHHTSLCPNCQSKVRLPTSRLLLHEMTGQSGARTAWS